MTGLLDETAFYSRDEWAYFLRVPREALDDWTQDISLPVVDRLCMILDVLRTRDVPAAVPFLATIDALMEQPAVQVSPLLSRMAPTLAEYLRGTFMTFGEQFRELGIEEQQRVLKTGSW